MLKFDFLHIIDESIKVKELLKKEVDKIKEIAEISLNAIKENKKILLCGNGGSASDAQHIACEIVAKLNKERKALPAIALNTNTSILTAISNDTNFKYVFSRQIEALGNDGDVLIAISTSGKSENVIEAVKMAKEKKMKTIALTGAGGDLLYNLCDYGIKVHSKSTQRIQEAHILIGHIIAEYIEEHFI